MPHLKSFWYCLSCNFKKGNKKNTGSDNLIISPPFLHYGITAGPYGNTKCRLRGKHSEPWKVFLCANLKATVGCSNSRSENSACTKGLMLKFPLENKELDECVLFSTSLQTQNMALCDRNSIAAAWHKGFPLEQLYTSVTCICLFFPPGIL